MADLSVTAGSVTYTSGETGAANAAATITAGQVIYINASSLAALAQADGTALEATIAGVALNGGSTGQRITYAKNGAIINIGATLVLGDIYCASVTAGAAGRIEELASTNYISVLGYPLSTSLLQLDIVNTGLQHGA
jgi:hypothetical protein